MKYCPKCGGYLLYGSDQELSCINCGWCGGNMPIIVTYEYKPARYQEDGTVRKTLFTGTRQKHAVIRRII
jgi:DNA-directed RNA polymerase subunit M/transcription elongation factor TFIIS